MTSQDDLALLKQMYERGEIGGGDYDVLRRHVLWGTPLPHLLDDPPPSTAARSARPRRDRGPSGGSSASSPAGRPPPREYPTAGGQARGHSPWADTDQRARHRAPQLSQAGDSPVPPPPVELPAQPASRARRAPRAERQSQRPTSLTAAPLPPPTAPVRTAPPDRWRPAGLAPSAHVTGSGQGPPSDWSPETYRDDSPWAPLPAAGNEPPSGPLPRVAGGDRRQPAVPRRRRRRGPRLLAALTSLLLSLCLVAAGVWWLKYRQTGVAAPAYARSVCTSVRDWQQEVDTGSSALVRSIARQGDRNAVRVSVARYYSDLATRTDALRGSLLAAGAADVPGGQAYADSLAAAVSDQSSAIRELAARASQLDVAAASFPTSLQGLLTGAETAVSDVTAALARPEAGTPSALRLALSDEPACAPYVG